jgi:hypothetical protein
MPPVRNSGIVGYDSASITWSLFYVAASARRRPFALSNFAGGSTIDFLLLTPMFGLRLVHTY